MPTKRVTIRGQVQGVGFRFFAVREAHALGVCGWVRNEPDGSVGAEIQAAREEVLERLIQRLREGPPASRVERIEVKDVDEAPAYSYFEIRR